jgi:uncharacterized cupredoxin-like copper-binding protein
MMRGWILAGLVVGILAFTAPIPPAEAQAKRVIRVIATSYKFEPSMIEVKQNETVVIQLVNSDPDRRNHSIAATLFNQIPVTSRGDVFRTGVAEDRRFFAVEPGKQLEVEFVATTRGSFPFSCGISNHAALGQVGAISVLAP